MDECNALIRELCDLDNSFEVVWIQGGGRLQFGMVPMNFLGPDDTAAFADTGHWAAEAMEYAAHYGKTDNIASSRSTNYNCLPALPAVDANYKYLHITTNNTIYGTQWHHVPDVNLPLIADMSSDILGCARNYRRFDLFYAATQKNLGTPGLALVVVRRSMLEKTVRSLPPMFSYAAHAAQNSILQTANVSAQYATLLMLRWIKEMGIEHIINTNKEKARILYHALDNSNLFIPHVTQTAHRSTMNVCFTAKHPETEQAFLKLCDDNNIIGIKGHRSVGGFRVSLYNAVPLMHVEKLVQLMNEFEKDI